jgi:CheY-like chemotaxis protein
LKTETAVPRGYRLKTVLYIESDPLILRTGTEIIRRMGFHVLAAGSGREAVRLMEETLPDGILLNCVLPDSDGCTLGRALKEDKRTCHIPIGFISNLEKPEDFHQSFKSGGKLFLAKPYTVRALQTALLSLLS